MESVGPTAPRLPLQGALTTDVAIVGAGFTGLWTAYELLKRSPSLKVVVLERSTVGFGASGRNGSWCVPELNAGPKLLSRRFGRDRALELYRAMCGAVDEIANTCAVERIDAHFEKAGVLLVARSAGQLPALQATYSEYREAGLAEHYHLLNARESGEVLDVRGAAAAISTPEGASLHPGRLVRGLAEAVERRGGIIHESTAVREVRQGRRPIVIVDSGEVRAQVVVLALEAYLSQLPGHRRQVLPVYSLIDLTEPLTAQQLASINWHSRVCVSSMRLTVDYLALTPDHRVLVGGRGAPYRYGSAINDGTEGHAPTHASLRAMFREWFPELAKVRFSHSWGGVLGMPRDWIPQVRYDKASGLALAYGYTGHGVATANLAGRCLSDLITGTATELTELPIVGHRSPLWEREPLRWLGVRYVQGQMARLDARSQRGGRPPTGRTLAERLGAH
ncbi:MAG: NAD(P)/FAD-dependent oxidoreductase [Candidatus Dormibacteria bacterium]